MEAISNVDATMSDFASASNMPLLLAPSGLDAARASVETGEAPKLTAVEGQDEREPDQSEESGSPDEQSADGESDGSSYKSYEARDDGDLPQSVGS